ncbi:BT_3928 family protein [Algivirga pacifica]|uniref:DoxX family protein n=1 Tax=Algivirga pacifica TaxID=1162670 RepID=A0ABP9D408_9BACT
MMRLTSKLLTFFVGGTFIFSGLIKVNDPKGTAIKLEEYFTVFADDVSSFAPFLEDFFLGLIPLAMIFSIVISSLEVILGTALLFGYRKKYTLKAILGLLLFFGFLTFYSAYFNKVTDCGCFGDAIKFTPWESFTKDLVLLVATLLIFAHPYNRSANYTSLFSTVMVAASTLACAGIAGYALMHLPIVDFRPYKIGANIPALLSPTTPCQYVYIMEKGGEEFEFQKYPTEPGYNYVSSRLLNEEACISPIPDFNFTDADGNDYTNTLLSGNKLVIIIELVSKANQAPFDDFVKLQNSLKDSSIEVVTLTADPSHYKAFAQEKGLEWPYAIGDATVLKAMIRSNPGIILLKDGVVAGKWHYNDTPSAEILLPLL